MFNTILFTSSVIQSSINSLIRQLFIGGDCLQQYRSTWKNLCCKYRLLRFPRSWRTNGESTTRTQRQRENEKKKNFLLVFDSHFATFFSLAATFNCTFLSFYIYLMNIYRLKIVLNKSEMIAIAIRKNESAHFLVSVNKFCVYLWVKRIVKRTVIVFCQWDFGCNQHWKSCFEHFFPPFACISYY